jgi:prepilin-type N-terminal cleavage/methylation domain-containing protein
VGFTLLELLVVLAIIGLLATLLIPSLKRAKGAAQSAACKNNLHQIGIAIRLYVDDFEKYPLGWFEETVISNGVSLRVARGWGDALLTYSVVDMWRLNCPTAKQTQGVFYGYNFDGTDRGSDFGSLLGLGGSSSRRWGAREIPVLNRVCL